jgi:diaminopimelate decarboxylase
LQGIVINVDDLAELDHICQLKKQLGISGKTSILVRLSGFHSARSRFTMSDGTFGVPMSALDELWTKLQACSNELVLEGFAFHLNTDSMEYRVLALEQTLSALFAARKRGLNARIVNIGGGFRIRYAKSSDQWERFIIRLKNSLLEQREICTWNRTGLGFSFDGGRITGAARYMDHAELLSPADQLCSLLKQELPSFSGVQAGRLLSESVIEMWIEPGRALLDQVGLTVAEAINVRKSEQGHPLLVLRMNRSNLNSFELTLLTDPILLPQKCSQRRLSSHYFLTGNLCVANELLTPRLVQFSQPVLPGDLVTFINTAPYIMDFAESLTLNQPVARKIAVWSQAGKVKWALDEEYRPFMGEEL